MGEQDETIVWITGATSGIGEALARTCPWPDTRIISISRREHPDHETVLFDLTDPGSWDAVGDHLAEVLATFRGQRAIFIHNALYYWGGRAYQGEGDPRNHRDEITANVVSPLVLGDLFLRAAQPAVDAGVDVGLVQISSASARIAYPGLAIYGAAKASMEQWVRAVRAERKDRGTGPWVTAIRPGFVDTPAARSRGRAAGRHAPRDRRDRRGGPDRQHARRRRVRREHLERAPRGGDRPSGAALRRGGRRHHLT